MSGASTDHYSFLDRLLHRLAFAHPGVQRALGQVENDMFKARLAEVEATHPVFVTGLPRAGTTLVLELLYGSGEFASFTYRHMPFVLNPLLWQRLSAGSRRQGEARERAHGDAMTISYDSPEAFEEVLWINRLGKTLFDGESMRPLGPSHLDDNFRDAFRLLTRKLVAAGQLERAGGATAPPLRYLSKNNANLSRLTAIRSVFPDAELVCVFRDPASHVASLHTQHQRFSAMHEDDRFARDYMAWIGHHDFGANFRPIRFAEPIDHPTDSRDFWLRYWVDAYRHVLDHAPANTRFLCYESLLDDGAGQLGRLGDAIGVDDVAGLGTAADRLRTPGSQALSLDDMSERDRDAARSIYAELSSRAL